MLAKLLRFVFAFICLLALDARAFSLLGPYEDWMTTDLGYGQRGDIGGPMGLGDEFRWNVPVVTYGFDESFVDYFGRDGVKAVEAAIKTLNQLPAASKIVLTNFSTDTRRENVRAAVLNLYDLKSTTLSLLLEQMGLNHPAENVFVLRLWNPAVFVPFPGEASWSIYIPYYVLERNFDPESFQPSHSVNDALYTGTAVGPGAPLGPDIQEELLDPQAIAWSAVAENRRFAGEFYTGLTRDDAGGLRYLLRKENINYEPLLPSVQIPAQRANDWMRMLARLVSNGRDQSTNAVPVRTAFRPGREHIAFVRHPVKGKSRRWLPFNYEFTDRYFDTEGTLHTRRVKRTVEKPDILFSAADLQGNSEWPPAYDRTSTTNWIRATTDTNGGTSTGEVSYNEFPGVGPTPANAGPGIISPPIKITFHKPIPALVTGQSPNAQIRSWYWSSFDNSTNSPVIYQERSKILSVRLRAYETNNSVTPVFQQLFNVDIPLGQFALFQISSNQTDWTTVFDGVINSEDMNEWEWRHHGNIFGPGVPASQLVFFRIVPAVVPSGQLSPEEQAILIEAHRLQIGGSPLPLPPTTIVPPSFGGPSGVEMRWRGGNPSSASEYFQTAPLPPQDVELPILQLQPPINP